MVLGVLFEDPFYFGGDSMAGFTVKLEVFYNAWKAMQDWITGISADKPKVEVDGTVEVSNLPTTQQVVGEVQVTNLPETQKDVVIGLLADRPPASEMRGRGYYAWDETDGHKLKYSDGTNWVVNK